MLRKPTWSAAKTFLFVIVFVGVVLMSPLAFLGLIRLNDEDLARLSNIGQAYGFASALISAAALFAVARSFRMQAQQSRASEIQAVRSMHAEVARLSFDYPEICGPAFGFDPKDTENLRNIWRALVAQYMVAGIELGQVTELDVREEFAAGLLRTEAGRNWWRVARQFHDQFSDRPNRAAATRIFDDVLNEFDGVRSEQAKRPANPNESQARQE